MEHRLSRASLLRLGAQAAACITAQSLTACGAGMTPHQLPQAQPQSWLPAGTAALRIANASGAYADSQVSVVVIGVDQQGIFHWLQPDGTLRACGFADTKADGYVDYAIPLRTFQSRPMPIPRLSGRIYVALGGRLLLKVVRDGNGALGIVQPAGWVKTDPNYNVLHDWVEFTYDQRGVNCNLTSVDMFSIPMTVELTGRSKQTAGALVTGGRNAIFQAMRATPRFSALVVGNSRQRNLRIVAPGHGIEAGIFPSTLFDAYIEQCWNHYRGSTLTITDAAYGTMTGSVDSAMKFNFTQNGALVRSLSKPSTKDVFLCNGSLEAPNNAGGKIANVVASAINRGTLLTSAQQPECASRRFYASSPCNLYSKILHQYTADDKAYGFAFDDLCAGSSDIADSSPSQLTMTIAPF